MVTAVIVEDEELARENLKLLISEFCPNVNVLAAEDNIEDGIKAIKQHLPDILFLDIKIQRNTGFELLKHFDTVGFEIIFTTAYAEFAIEAIKFSAIDYLLKPIDLNELREAISKVEKKNTNDNVSQKIEALFHNLQRKTEDYPKIAVPSTNGLTIIHVKDILYCEAEGNYTKIHLLKGQSLLICKTLKEYDLILSKFNFFRIHHGFLVNLNEVNNYVRGDGGYVVMSNKKEIDVSKRKKEDFLKRLENMSKMA
jgi:two-component system, LytTR family, response regulator